MKEKEKLVGKVYSDYIHKSRYARYLDSEGRRETWEETVTRYMDALVDQCHSYEYAMSTKMYNELRQAILNHEIMPSMRALMTAGPALDRDNVAGYNCAYVPIDDRKVFDEIMYVLMCGTGVGFSVERRYIEKLPVIAEEFHPADAVIYVADSRIGWATAYRKLISLLYDGLVPVVDYSRIRPHGARLKTFGGRASGPQPLKDLVDYTIEVFQNARGRRLNSLECHDLVCKIAEVVVCGGVRRSALISLSNLTDERIRNAKSGQWYFANPHRALANNSVCYTERPDIGMFLKEWTALYDSKSGERGIFSRNACSLSLPERREDIEEWGTNPCSEIILRPRQFCNLTEVVCRPEDTDADIKRKIRLATILGTIQSTFTQFRYLSPKWKENCIEERLLGVSLTGIMDCPAAYSAGKKELTEWRDHAISVNERWATNLNINSSAAITCVKPSGTVSQLVNSSSGIHPRYSKYYIRRIRADKKDPMSTVLKEHGVPCEEDVMNDNQYVFSFPLMSPEEAYTIDNVDVLEQLELWYRYDKWYCEHKPSVSIYVKEDDWIQVAAWVYDHFDRISGISFFPTEEHVYKQAPYEAITKEQYETLLKDFPSTVPDFDVAEEGDHTIASQELACSGGACEL